MHPEALCQPIKVLLDSMGSLWGQHCSEPGYRQGDACKLAGRTNQRVSETLTAEKPERPTCPPVVQTDGSS